MSNELKPKENKKNFTWRLDPVLVFSFKVEAKRKNLNQVQVLEHLIKEWTKEAANGK